MSVNALISRIVDISTVCLHGDIVSYDGGNVVQTSLDYHQHPTVAEYSDIGEAIFNTTRVELVLSSLYRTLSPRLETLLASQVCARFVCIHDYRHANIPMLLNSSCASDLINMKNLILLVLYYAFGSNALIHMYKSIHMCISCCVCGLHHV